MFTLDFGHTPLNKREKGTKFSTDSEPSGQPYGFPTLPGPAQAAEASLPAPHQWIDFSAEDDPDFFVFVVKHKVPKLPEPPASKQCAALGWIRKYGNRLYSEYLQWLEGQKEVAIAQATAEAIEQQTETPSERLQRYQTLWQTPACRKGVRSAIQQHPEWHLEVGTDGPRAKPADVSGAKSMPL